MTYVRTVAGTFSLPHTVYVKKVVSKTILRQIHIILWKLKILKAFQVTFAKVSIGNIPQQYHGTGVSAADDWRSLTLCLTTVASP